MLRIVKDRYRPLFCSDAFYLHHQETFKQWNQLFKDLSSTEKVQAWTLGLSILRRSTDWFGGLRKQPFIENIKNLPAHPIRLEQLLTPENSIVIPTRLRNMHLLEVINEVRIKAVPESALRSLARLTNQIYPLEVSYSVPTPLELLQIQLQGKRIISFNEDFQTWPVIIYHGRDFLSFIIHDLIHADHFFATPEHRLGQLGFYHCVQKIWSDDDLQTLIQNSEFKEAFEYIISDMNSHPVHLFKTLHARVLHSNENELKANTTWNTWTLIWENKNPMVISALQKINTQLFSDKDALAVTEWSIALGHHSVLA